MMNIYSWSIDLGWSFIGAAAGLTLDRLFDSRMSTIVSVLAGLGSLVLVFAPPSSVEQTDQYIGILLGCFTGSLALILWKRLLGMKLLGCYFLALHTLLSLFLGLYALIIILKVFRFHYGLGPSYSLTDPLLLFGLLTLQGMVFLRVLFLGPLSLLQVFVILVVITLYIAQQCCGYFVIFQLIGWVFIDNFQGSCLLTLAMFPLEVILALLSVLCSLAVFTGRKDEPEKSHSEEAR